MPVITIVGKEELDIDKKKEMIKKVSESVAEAYDLPVSTITVLIQPIAKDNVASGGQLISELYK